MKSKGKEMGRSHATWLDSACAERPGPGPEHGPDWRQTDMNEFFDRYRGKPFAEYLSLAYDYALTRHLGPPDSEVYRTPLFELTYLLRGHREMRGLTTATAWDKVCSTADEAGLGGNGGEFYNAFDYHDAEEDAKSEFADLWTGINFPAGSTPLSVAFDRSIRCPVELPAAVLERRLSANYPKLVSVAAHLQELVGDGPILLPTTSMGLRGPLNCSEMSISRYRKWAVADGFLRPTKAANRAKLEAAEFRYVGPRPVCAEEA